MATKIAIFVVAALGVLDARRAHAQSAEAEALFDEGDKLMTQGKLAQACAAFEASNRAEPRAGTLIRLGDCRERTQQLASAWSAYKDALTRVKDPRKRDIATGKVAELAPRLSYLTVQVSEHSRINGLTVTRNGESLDAMLWNRALPVDGGDYVIVAHATGHADWRTSLHVAASGAKVSIAVPVLEQLSSQTAGLAVSSADRPSTRLTPRRKVAIGVAGVAAIGVIVGAVLGEAANGKKDDAFALCPDPATPCNQASQADSLIKAGQNRALAANVAFGVAAGAAIAAGILWFTGAPEPEAAQLRVAPSVSSGQAGLVVMGTF